jgi:uncharacterized protein YecT (DUF1311 family)
MAGRASRRCLGVAALLLMLCSGRAAVAQSACDKPRNPFDSVYCMSKLYQQADSDLNVNYSKLLGRLDGPEQQALHETQLVWLRRRDDQCSRRDDHGEFYVNLACATRTTIARNRFLEDRYRECVSTGCLDSKLAGPD